MCVSHKRNGIIFILTGANLAHFLCCSYTCEKALVAIRANLWARRRQNSAKACALDNTTVSDPRELIFKTCIIRHIASFDHGGRSAEPFTGQSRYLDSKINTVPSGCNHNRRSFNIGGREEGGSGSRLTEIVKESRSFREIV